MDNLSFETEKIKRDAQKFLEAVAQVEELGYDDRKAFATLVAESAICSLSFGVYLATLKEEVENRKESGFFSE